LLDAIELPHEKVCEEDKFSRFGRIAPFDRVVSKRVAHGSEGSGKEFHDPDSLSRLGLTVGERTSLAKCVVHQVPTENLSTVLRAGITAEVADADLHGTQSDEGRLLKCRDSNEIAQLELQQWVEVELEPAPCPDYISGRGTLLLQLATKTSELEHIALGPASSGAPDVALSRLRITVSRSRLRAETVRWQGAVGATETRAPQREAAGSPAGQWMGVGSHGKRALRITRTET
jgi:hypothetical protein